MVSIFFRSYTCQYRMMVFSTLTATAATCPPSGSSSTTCSSRDPSCTLSNACAAFLRYSPAIGSSPSGRIRDLSMYGSVMALPSLSIQTAVTPVTLQNSFCRCCRRFSSINSRNAISATFLLPCFSVKYPKILSRIFIFYHASRN